VRPYFRATEASSNGANEQRGGAAVRVNCVLHQYRKPTQPRVCSYVHAFLLPHPHAAKNQVEIER